MRLLSDDCGHPFGSRCRGHVFMRSSRFKMKLGCVFFSFFFFWLTCCYFAGNFMWWTCIWKIEFMFDELSNLTEYVVLGSCRNIHAWVMWCDWESHCVCSLYCINWNDSDKMKKKKNISCFIEVTISLFRLYSCKIAEKVLETLIVF